MIRFVVLGVPQPRGSKSVVAIPKRGGGWVTTDTGRPVVAARDDNPRSKDWMRAVACAAREAWGGELLTGPVAVEVMFYLPRPKGHFGTGKNANALKKSALVPHIQRPDCDKLLRGTLDALKGVIWRDDSQVTRVVGEKLWTVGPARAVIEIVEH